MDVLDRQVAVLTNYEVHKLLHENRSRGDHGRNQSVSSLATITYETHKFLENTPASCQDQNAIDQFLQAVKNKNFNLSQNEQIMLLNLRPTTAVEISLIVPSVSAEDERLNDEQTEDLLQIIQEILPVKPVVNE